MKFDPKNITFFYVDSGRFQTDNLKAKRLAHRQGLRVFLQQENSSPDNNQFSDGQ